MNTKNTLFALLTVIAPATPLLAQGKPVEPGDQVSYSFREPLLNGKGLKSLDELRGKPVLLEFWGMRCPPCVGSAVPMSVKMGEQYGDELAIVMIESQGNGLEKMATFCLGKKWFGGSLMWTTERPVETGARGIPNYVLLSNEGKVLMKGNPISDHAQIEEAIHAEIRRARSAPESAPKALAGAWKDFARGKTAKALQSAEKMSQSDDADEAKAATEALAAFRARIDERFERIAWLIENGHYADADDQLGELKKSLSGWSAGKERVAELEERLKSAELKDERAAEKKLIKLERFLFENGPEAAIVRKLAKFAEKEQGTKAAERASRWVTLAGGLPG